MTTNARISQIIKSRKGLTQKGLSESIGVPLSTVNNWLKNGGPIPSEYIVPIAEYLCVSPIYLLTGRDEADALSEEDSDWLSLVHQLPDDAKTLIHKMIEGYLKD